MIPLLLLSVLFASLNSVLLHRVRFEQKGAIYRFNLICAAVWCICLLAANGFRLQFTPSVLLWGAVYGITQTLFVFFKTAAMNSGPVSVTTLIGNCSLAVSIFVCFSVWKEPIGAADLAGLILLLVGVGMSTYQKSLARTSGRWAVLSTLFFLCAAGVGISFKAFSKSGGAAQAGDMMAFSALVMLVSYGLICLFTGRDQTTPADKKGVLTFVGYAVVSGLFSCLYNRLNITLSGALDAIVFFPAFNGGVVFLSAVLSLLLLRERLILRQMIGILIGIIGICIIGIL